MQCRILSVGIRGSQHSRKRLSVVHGLLIIIIARTRGRTRVGVWGSSSRSVWMRACVCVCVGGGVWTEREEDGWYTGR